MTFRGDGSSSSSESLVEKCSVDGSSTSESVASYVRLTRFAGTVLPLRTQAAGTLLGSEPGSGFARAHAGIGRF